MAVKCYKENNVNREKNLFVFPIAFKQASPFDGQHPYDTFANDVAAHFGDTFDPLGKDNRHLGYLEAKPAGGKFHLYLKGITYKMNTR